MTQDEMAKVMTKVFEECQEVRGQGQKEYAHDTEDSFRNFNQIGKYLNTDRKKVLLTYAIKHMDGIVAYVNGHKSQREDVRGRIKDIIVYMCLLRGMIDEESVTDKT